MRLVQFSLKFTPFTQHFKTHRVLTHSFPFFNPFLKYSKFARKNTVEKKPLLSKKNYVGAEESVSNYTPIPTPTQISAKTLTPDEASSQEEKVLEAFCSISQIDSAWCHAVSGTPKSPLNIMVAMSQRNLTENKIRKFISHAHIPDPQGDLSTFYWTSFPQEMEGVTRLVPSPSGSRLFLVRNGEVTKEKKKPVKIEVWGAGRLLQEYSVPVSVHGSIYNDGWFEGISWNEDESAISYVAESPPNPPPTFGYKRSNENQSSKMNGVGHASSSPSNGGDEPHPSSWKGVGDWVEDWGEQYTGKGRPLIFVYDLHKNTVLPVEGIPEGISVGQVVWSPLPSTQIPHLVFVGWSEHSTNFGTSKRLGMIYCSNRPCYLLTIPSPTSPIPISNPYPVAMTTISAISPRFSPNGLSLAFLSSQAAVSSGVHSATNSLHVLPWPVDGFFSPSNDTIIPTLPPSPHLPNIRIADLPIKTIIDVVAHPEEINGFPGLYCSAMIRNPWLGDGKTLLMTTYWRSSQAIIAVNVESGHVSRLTPEGPISWLLHDVLKNVVVAGASTPACPTKLMFGRINAGWLKSEGWLWSEISPPHVEYSESVEHALKSTEFEVIPIPVSADSPASDFQGANLPFEAIYIRKQEVKAGFVPKSSVSHSPSPLIVVPHGGPHTVTPTVFSMPYAYLCALGFNILHVNYRGSLGFGEEALQSLPKNIGSQDVSDVLAALDKTISLGYVDPSNVFVLGGSHGGFLASHLIGQAPERFRTAAIRNPVCNLASMVTTSDIPDWCYVEALGTAAGMAAYSEAPSLTDLQTFYDVSPISHVNKVIVPTLFLFGGKDRRVPPSNGLQFVHALRAQGLESKVLFFPEDSHPLDKPQTEFEHWLNIALWFKKHLN